MPSLKKGAKLKKRNTVKKHVKRTKSGMKKPLSASVNNTVFGVQKTGIRAFDAILNGGIPQGFTVLLAGKSGTGKTLLALEWLYRGHIEFSEPGLYLSLTEPITKLSKNISSMNFYKKYNVQSQGIHLVDMRTMLAIQGAHLNITPKNSKKVINSIIKLVKTTGARRLIIDSITALEYMIEDQAQIRDFIFTLGTQLETINCTTILTAEVTGDNLSNFGVEEFISDGIIHLDTGMVGTTPIRRLQVIKMRGKNYIQNKVDFQINASGIEFHLSPTLKLDYLAQSKKISTGIDGVDTMLKGGIFEGSATFLSGSTGTGKSIFSMHFIQAGIKKKEPGLYICFEESPSQIQRNAKQLGFNLDNNDLVFFYNSHPEEFSPNEHLDAIMHMINKHHIKRCVLDSVSSFETVIERRDVNLFVKKLIFYLKNKNITTVFTAATDKLFGLRESSENQLSILTDVIILQQYSEIESKIKRVMTVLKMRGSDHSKDLKEYTITNRGIVVGKQLTEYEGILSSQSKRISETTDNKLKELLNREMGIEGVQLFNQLQKTGITDYALIDKINDLVKQKKLDEETGQKIIRESKSVLETLYSESMKKFSKK
jgi:circadian clock protein KaiC